MILSLIHIVKYLVYERIRSNIGWNFKQHYWKTQKKIERRKNGQT
jgi:hypothetical protein